MEKKKSNFSTILLVVILLVGLSLLLYPTVSDYWNSFHQTRAIASYDAALANMEPEDFTAYFKEAEAYNEKLKECAQPLINYEEIEGYTEALDVTGNGIMGYITIPKINVELPIYHTTDEAVLQIAVGHLEGSSLPTGGEGNHCVVSSHRGLPSARLFTDLDDLEIGDTFTMTVLDRLLTYEVDQILIVEPSEVAELAMIEGKDYCTLVTCTPYGINTHRMLVRGHWIENAEEQTTVHVSADAVQIEPMIVAPIVAIPILLILLIILLVQPKKKQTDKKDLIITKRKKRR